MAKRPPVNPLLRFMRRYARDRALVERAWRTISLFVDIGDAQRYPLVDAKDLDPAECMLVLRTGLQTVVDDIRFVSVGDQMIEEDHRTIDGYLNYPARSLAANRRRDVDAILGDDSVDEFVELFWEELGNRILMAFVKTHDRFMQLLDFQLGGVVSAVPSLSLFYFLLYAMSGQEDKIAEMEPFMLLSTEAIAIGEPFDLDGTWLVLTA